MPTGHARGPWDPDALHGGPPAGLLARAVEEVDAPGPMRCTRLTIELLRAVPMTPLHTEAVVLRGGRRLQIVEASLLSDGGEVCRARAVRLRVHDVDVPGPRDDKHPPGPHDSQTSPYPGGGNETGFHRTGMDIRFARGTIRERGPAIGWFRLAMPLVAGEEPTPLQRAVCAADFGNGISRELDFDTHLFVNPDLSLHLHREPRGEWVAVDARTDLEPDGIGQAISILRDEDGRIGVAAQSLFVDRR